MSIVTVDSSLEEFNPGVFDRNLMYLENWTIASPASQFNTLCPAVAKAIEITYIQNPHFLKWNKFRHVTSITSSALHSILRKRKPLNHFTKQGLALKKLIFLALIRKSSSVPIHLKCWKKIFEKSFWRKSQEKVQSEDITIPISYHEYFSPQEFGQKLESSLKLFSGISSGILLIPLSIYFPLADFMILYITKNNFLNKKRKNVVLYLFQMTTQLNAHGYGSQESMRSGNHLSNPCNHLICDVSYLKILE